MITAILTVTGVAMVAMAARVALRPVPPRGPSRRATPRWAREAPVSRAEADRRSLDLLRSVVNPEEWQMFTDLGFICVTGRRFRRDGREGLPRYRYMIYPHLPLVALLPRSMAPVREYCIQFPEVTGRGDPTDGSLPIGDDVLAKWMTVRADEDRLLSYANVCNAGCQIPLSQIERDLRRLNRWQAQQEKAPEAAPAISARY